MRHICMLVDCSQSMVHIIDKIYESLLLILLKIQEKDEDILVSYAGFNKNYHHCFTRKKAKYLSVLPQPFANGGTSIYSSVTSALQRMEFSSDDDILFVLATDGRDESDYYATEVEKAKQQIAETFSKVSNAKMIFVSLSQAALIDQTAKALGYTSNDCVWGGSITEMLDKFVTRVLNEL